MIPPQLLPALFALTAPLLLSVPGDRPAPVLQPEPPPNKPFQQPLDETEKPAGGKLARDGWVADQFSAKGRVRYAFQSEPGELSLFDLGTWGYSRGWAHRVGLRVIGPDKAEQARVTGEGGNSGRLFLAFQARQGGRHLIEVQAPAAAFRYTLVRHSNYTPRAPRAPQELAHDPHAGGLTHGYLADPQDARIFRVPVRSGEPIALRVRPTHPGARSLARQARKAAPMRLVRGQDLVPERTQEDGGRRRASRHAQGMVFPFVTMRIETPEGAVLAERPHYLLWTPTEDGEVSVTVRISEGEDGGLFELEVERGLELVPVSGRVGDHDDEPVAGLSVHFLHEEELDHVTSVRTARDGTWEADLVPGRYMLLHEREGGPVETVRVAVAPATTEAINTIYTD